MHLRSTAILHPVQHAGSHDHTVHLQVCHPLQILHLELKQERSLGFVTPLAERRRQSSIPQAHPMVRTCPSTSLSVHLQLLEFEPQVDEPHYGIFLLLRVIRELQNPLLALFNCLPQLLDIRGQEQALQRKSRSPRDCQCRGRGTTLTARPHSQAV